MPDDAKALVTRLVKAIEGGLLPMKAFEAENLERPYQDILKAVQDQMGAAKFKQVVEPLREKMREERRLKRGNKNDSATVITAAKRHVNGLEHLVKRRAVHLNIQHLIELESSLQAILADLLVFKAGAKDVKENKK